MLKYPDSKLARMYNEGQKIKNLNFFLDEDPEYFRIVLNFLRNGKIIKFEDENLFEGVCDLAKNLELTEIVKLFEREYGFSTVVFEFGMPLRHEMKEEEITIVRKFLTRVPDSHLAKFFFGDQGSQNPLSKWIFKKGPNRYFIRQGSPGGSNHKAGLTKHILNFMDMSANSQFKTCGSNVFAFGMQQQFSSIDFLKELELYGIQEFDHFKKLPGNPYIISWNENYNVN